MLKENNILEKVIEKIHGGEVAMHSRTYFILRTVFISIVALFTLVSFFFLLSFVFFSVHKSGIGFLLAFNAQGLMTFLSIFPWLTLLIALSLLIALEALVRNFAFGYRFPLLRIFLWLLIIGIAGSTLLGLTPLHPSLLSAADIGQLPVLGTWYEQIHDSHQAQGVYRGEVTSVASSSFVISHNDTDRDSDEGTWHIIPPAGFGLNTLSVGDKAYVAGRLINGVVHAYGIRHVQDEKSDTPNDAQSDD